MNINLEVPLFYSSPECLIDHELFNLFYLDNPNTNIIDYGLSEIKTVLPNISMDKIDQYLDFCTDSYRFQKLISLPIFNDLIKLADANLIKFNDEFILTWKNHHRLHSSKIIQIHIDLSLFEKGGDLLFQIFKSNYSTSVRTDKWLSFVKRLNMIGFKMTHKTEQVKVYTLSL